VLIPPSPQALDPDAWEAEHEANPPAAKGARKSKSKSKGRKKRCVAFLVVSLSLSFCLALLSSPLSQGRGGRTQEGGRMQRQGGGYMCGRRR
jgi:hypothetical protein